jgi:hypothetical protein
MAMVPGCGPQSMSEAFVVALKAKKKKVAFPRRTWQINPVTRVKRDVQQRDW